MQKIRSWCTRHPNWTLAWLTAALLLPFCAKPFNLDDPLFIWVAKQIQAHPADPFGFTVNWGLTAIPMWKATENPPLACYYLALAGGLLGWSEVALHLAFILPAVGVVLGTHRLARHFCGSPMLAALAALCTPVFMISSLTLMSDVLMLAFWVWAVIFWVEGLNLPHPAGLSSDLSPSPALPSPLPSDGRGEGQGKVRVPRVHGERLRTRGENYIRPPLLSLEVHGEVSTLFCARSS
ncbi:MAG: ArnT family glycosyltransferase [Limisphaerales bacterium]